MTRPLPRPTTLLIALVIVVVDQLSKAAASSALRVGQSLPLLPHLLSLQLVHNTGAAFSVLQGHCPAWAAQLGGGHRTDPLDLA